MRTGFIARVFAVTAVLAVTVVALGGVTTLAASNQQQVESDALGLTRDQLETIWGPAIEAVVMPGQPVTDEMFRYEVVDVMINVAYRDVNGEQIAIYVELYWLGDGVSQAVATETIERLLPADASMTELYVAPPTPNGPVALSIYRYTSESLGDSHGGLLATEILVIEQHAWMEAAGISTITSINLMIRERTQLTS